MKKIVMSLALVLVVVLGSGFAFQGAQGVARDPVKVLVWLLDFKLDLTDAQEQEIRGIVQPVFVELKAERTKDLAPAREIIGKIKDGKLEKADVTGAMERRRAFAAAHQDKIAATVVAVFQVLTPEQRATLGTLMETRLNEAVK